MSESMFDVRLERFRKLCGEEGLDAFLVANPENRYYLSGYEADDMHLTESSGFLLITPDRQYLLTDPRYEEAARKEAPGFSVRIYTQGLSQVLAELLPEMRPERLGVESSYLTWSRYKDVEEQLRKANPSAVVLGFEGLAERLRVIKEPMEIEWIKASLRLTEDALVAVWTQLEPGHKEKDIAWRIERYIREGGGEAVSFPPIVAAGPNGALPHAVPGERRIAKGESLILDLGSKLRHYCSDMTRTWIAGNPEPKLAEIYRVVREAQLAAQDQLRAGIDSVEVDRVARDLIAKAGYGEYFGHGLGHGVGLAVHEGPSLRRFHGTILEENMVVTVEPGIYLPGYGGVRLENMVRITATGCEVLNTRDLFLEQAG